MIEKKIYPNNVTLCKSNCKYNSVNIDEQRVICTCNLNSGKNAEEEEFEEDDGNFFTYFLDYINYNVFKCYKLIFNINNLNKSYPFYIILTIFAMLQLFNFIYFCFTIERIKIELGKVMFLKKKTKFDHSEIRKMKNNNIANPNPKKKVKHKSSDKLKNISTNNKNNSDSGKNTYIFLLNNKQITNNIVPIVNGSIEKKDSFEKFKNEKENIDNLNNKEEDINELPFSKAKRVDK